MARRNQLSPLAVGLMSVEFQRDAMVRIAQNAKGQFDTAQTAIMDAHDQLSFELQGAMQDELRKRVDARGRFQHPGEHLLDALVDERNRKVNIYGFSVGYLEDIPEVSKYWRRIELGDIGAGVKYKRLIHGFFRTQGGKLVGPNPDERFQIDPRLIQVGKQQTRPAAFATNLKNAQSGNPKRTQGGQRVPGIMIENPIPAYEYIRQGRRTFLRGRFNGGGKEGDGARRIYIQSFDRYGLDFVRRSMERTGAEPGPRPFL